MQRQFFGVSLKDAKKQDAFTPQAYLELVEEKTTIMPISRLEQNELSEFRNYIEESYQELKIIFNEVVIEDEETKAAIDQLKAIYFLLIFVEVMLFCLVNAADLMINSSSKNEPNTSITP